MEAEKEVVKSTSEFVDAILKIPGRAKQHLVIGLLLVALAILSLSTRYFIMHNAHSVAKHAHLYADMINVAWDLLLGTMVVMITVLEEIWSIVRGVIRFFEGEKADIANHFSNFNRQHLGQYLNPVKATDLANSAATLPVRCEDYVGAYPVLQGMIRPFSDPVLCPVVRWTYPSPTLWSVANGALGWLTYGAQPPGDLGSCLDCSAPNCNTNTTGLTDSLCVGLGVGYVIAEVLVPLLVLQIAWPAIWVAGKGAVTTVGKVALSWSTPK